MKTLAFALGMALLLAACGGNKPRSPIDGTWHAVGTGGTGQNGQFDFTITPSATSNNGLNITNSTFPGSNLSSTKPDRTCQCKFGSPPENAPLSINQFHSGGFRALSLEGVLGL